MVIVTSIYVQYHIWIWRVSSISGRVTDLVKEVSEEGTTEVCLSQGKDKSEETLRDIYRFEIFIFTGLESGIVTIF